MNLVPKFEPTANNSYIISYPSREEGCDYEYDFATILSMSHDYERAGDVERACNLRFDAFQQLVELLPEDEEITLEWENDDNQTLMELIRSTSIDHFLVGDYELAAGMMELLLDLDPEDHLEVTKPLSYCYIALGEYELFDEIIDDISDKYPEKEILKLWSEFKRNGAIPHGELIHLKKSFPVVYAEFIADNHHISKEFIADIEGARPSRENIARELWLQTEHLWLQNPEFIEALKKA